MLCVAVDVCEEVLVHEMGLYRVHVAAAAIVGALGPALEEDAGEHAVAVEPVGVAPEVLVGDGVGAIADVLAAGEVKRDLALVDARREGERRMDGRKVAREVAVMERQWWRARV